MNKLTAKEQAMKMAEEIISKTTTPQEAIEVAGIILAAGIGILSAFAKQGKLSDNMLLALIEDLKGLESDLSTVYKTRARH